jgi:hypothetical protein
MPVLYWKKRLYVDLVTVHKKQLLDPISLVSSATIIKIEKARAVSEFQKSSIYKTSLNTMGCGSSSIAADFDFMGKLMNDKYEYSSKTSCPARSTEIQQLIEGE